MDLANLINAAVSNALLILVVVLLFILLRRTGTLAKVTNVAKSAGQKATSTARRATKKD